MFKLVKQKNGRCRPLQSNFPILPCRIQNDKIIFIFQPVKQFFQEFHNSTLLITNSTTLKAQLTINMNHIKR